MMRPLRRFLHFCLLALTLFLSSALPARTPADEAAVRAVYDVFRSSWNTPGMPHFEDIFTPDADFVVITGQWLKGRQEIASYHRKLLGSAYAGSSLSIDGVDVRFVRDDLAIVHMRSGAKFGVNGAEAARTSLSTSTLVKVAGQWKIAAFHNTLTGGPGFAFAPPRQGT